MDGLGDWELLSDDLYGETHKSLNPNSRSKSVFQFEDYFSYVGTQLVPVPIQFNPTIGNALHDEEVTKLPIESSVVPSEATNQVCFVKMKETDQFVDMKMDSPKSGSRVTILPQIDAGGFQFEPNATTDGKMSSQEAAEEGGGGRRRSKLMEVGLHRNRSSVLFRRCCGHRLHHHLGKPAEESATQVQSSHPEIC